MPLGWAFKILGWFTGANIKKVITFVIENWREVLIVLLASIVLYQNKFETRYFFGAETIPALQSDLTTVKNNLKTCVDGNAKLSTAIDENNARIEAYEQLKISMQGDIDRLKGELDVARATTNTEVDIILKDPTPKTCEKAIDYLRDAGRELQW